MNISQALLNSGVFIKSFEDMTLLLKDEDRILIKFSDEPDPICGIFEYDTYDSPVVLFDNKNSEGCNYCTIGYDMFNKDNESEDFFIEYIRKV